MYWMRYFLLGDDRPNELDFFSVGSMSTTPFFIQRLWNGKYNLWLPWLFIVLSLGRWETLVFLPIPTQRAHQTSQFPDLLSESSVFFGLFFVCLFVCQLVFCVFFWKSMSHLNVNEISLIYFTYLFLYFQSFEAPTKNKPTVSSSVKVDSEKTKNKYHTHDQKGKHVFLTSCTYLK